MLTEGKQNEILIQRNFGRKCPQFKNDIKLSENDHNYALSICFRKTFIKDWLIYYEIIDPDSAAVTTALNLPTEEIYHHQSFHQLFPQSRLEDETRVPDTSYHRHFIFGVTSYQREKLSLHTSHFIPSHFIQSDTSYQSHFIPKHFNHSLCMK